MSSKCEQAGQAGATRDEQGRFVAGNPGGPGNPYGRRVAELRRAMLEAVSAEDIAAIVRAMIEKAKEGNTQAAKIVLGYALGKPDKAADPDRADAQEWELQRETAAMYAEMDTVIKAPPGSVTVGVARILRPLVGSIVKEQMADALLHPEKHFEEFAEEEPKANGESAGRPEMEALWRELQRRGHGVNGKQTVKTGG